MTTKIAATTSPRNSWRDRTKIHPAANLFPLMPEPELRALGNDIKKRGLRDRVGFLGDELLDGRNRLDAMELVGLDIDFEKVAMLVWNPGCPVHGSSGFDPYAYVISANIRRRHLTAEQKLELIAKLRKENPEKSNRQIAKMVKASPTTVGKVTAKLAAAGDVSTVDTRTDTKGRKQPASKPARARKAPVKKSRPSEVPLTDFGERLVAGIGSAIDALIDDKASATKVATGNDIDTEVSAEMRKQAAAADEVVEITTPAAPNTTLLEHRPPFNKVVLRRAERVIEELGSILRQAELHPDRINVDLFSERLMVKAPAFVELAQRRAKR